jgi:hypothetical protein
VSHRGSDEREDDMVKSMAIASYRDKPMRRGRAAGGAYKEVPSLAFG